MSFIDDCDTTPKLRVATTPLRRRLQLEEDDSPPPAKRRAVFYEDEGEDTNDNARGPWESKKDRFRQRVDRAENKWFKKFEKPAGISNGFLVKPVTKFIDYMNKFPYNDASLLESGPIDRPAYADMLSGEVAAWVKVNKKAYPVMVKQLYQARKQGGEPKKVKHLVEERQPEFYVQRNKKVGAWEVKKGTKVWYECMNVMATCDAGAMFLICYTPYGDDVLPVKVTFEKGSYTEVFEQMQQYLLGMPCLTRD